MYCALDRQNSHKVFILYKYKCLPVNLIYEDLHFVSSLPLDQPIFYLTTDIKGAWNEFGICIYYLNCLFCLLLWQLDVYYVPFFKVIKVAISGNTKWVVSACQNNTIKLWDTSSGKEVFTSRVDAEVQHMKFTPNSKYVVILTGTNHTRVLIYRIHTGSS